ncbi:hypothetical protein HRI_002176000 [Hibiscus trionum]|uniref:HMA domain-containing protein n=1 Tax=Hibiscus trionum TaxID=183268 RepID=A0A9W7M0M5_HIBTR|nr:hypothetical protein HRI_002176000 [Hibiscus trionum]
MESRAEMSCVLKLDVNCAKCRRKVMDVLQNLHGAYSVVIDAEKGILKVSGNVNPCIIMNIFEKYGKHGEITCIKFEGGVREPMYHPHSYYYGRNGFSPYESVNPYPLMGGPDPYFSWYDRNRYAFLPLPSPSPLSPPQPVVNYIFPPRAPPVVPPPDEMNPNGCNII